MAVAEAVRTGRVAVVGGSGFIGRHLCGLLAGDGSSDVRAYSSREVDLLDAESTAALAREWDADTTVVFAAAITRMMGDSLQSLLDNLRMAGNVAAALPETGVKSVVFVSSAEVYGRPPTRLPIDEDTPLKTIGYYDLSKLSAEMLLRSQLRGACPLTVLRFPGVYGWDDCQRSVVGKFVASVREGETITLTGDGSVGRDYVDVDDAARVIAAFIRRPFDGVVNVATGASTPIRDIVRLAGEALGKEPAIRYLPDAETWGDMVFDTTRLRTLLPEVRFKTLAEGIRDYVDQR